MKRKITLLLIPGRGSRIRALEFPDVMLHLFVVAAFFLLGSGVLAMRSEVNFLEGKKRLGALAAENDSLRAEIGRMRGDAVLPVGGGTVEMPKAADDHDATTDDRNATADDRGGREPSAPLDPDPLGTLLAQVSEMERGYGAALAGMSAESSHWARVPTILPVRAGEITSGFGMRFDPVTGDFAMHEGLDVSAPAGSPVRATAAGEVAFAGSRAGYGNVLDIDHGDGVLTRYAHLASFRAKAGQKVVRGTVIGIVGTSGYATGPHVHYEVHASGRAQDPERYILPSGVSVD